LRHILRIKHKELHSHFLKHDKFEGNISYLRIVIRRCLKLGILDEKYKDFNFVGRLK